MCQRFLTLGFSALLWVATASGGESKNNPEPTNLGPSHAGVTRTYQDGHFQNYEGSLQRSGANGNLWVHIIHEPGATFLKAWFEDYHLMPGDTLEIRDADGNIRQRLQGSGPGGKVDFWSLSVPGDTMILQIESRWDYIKRFAFKIPKIFRGEMDLFGLPSANRSVCSDPRASPYRSAWCYSEGQQFEDPNMWANATSSVGVLTIGNYGSGSWCSGSLVSSQDYILTNQHCIENLSQCGNAEFVFNYYRNTCEENIGGEDPIITQGYYCDDTNSDTFFTNPFGPCTPSGLNELDYAFAHVLLNGPGGSPSEIYPVVQMELDHETIENTVEMYISGHPEGNARVISEGEMDFTTPFGLHYVCDTRGGSSGSPVFSRETHKLIGLHHCGGCTTPADRNRGMFISQIRADIDTHGSFFDPRALLTFNSIAYSDEVGGDNDGIFDLGEVIDVEVEISNTGNLASQEGLLVMSSPTTNITILQGQQTIPVLQPEAEGPNSTVLNFSFRIETDFTCGSSFRIDLDAEYGDYNSAAGSTLPTGTFAVTNTGLNSVADDTPIAIPDNDQTGIASTINLVQSGGVRIDQVTVDITHTYIGDLEVSLVSPSGTTVILHNRTGGTADNLNVVYGDGTGGTVVPAQSLDAVFGEPVNGAWALRVRDLAGGDNGTLDNFELDFSLGEFDCQTSLGFVTLGSMNAAYGDTISVPATLDSLGSTEYGFDVVFNPADFVFTGMTPGPGSGGLAINAIEVEPGRVVIDVTSGVEGGSELLNLNMKVHAFVGVAEMDAGNCRGGITGYNGQGGDITLPGSVLPCSVMLGEYVRRTWQSAYFHPLLDMDTNGQLNALDLIHRVNCAE